MITGKGTVIHKPKLSNLHPNAVCGEDCRIHSHCWIGDHVKIGNRVKIQAYVFIPSGVTIGDDVFIGPRVTFTNDKKPPSHHIGWMETHVERFAVIGAGAVILPGIKIGQGALVGAGSVVTKDVAPYTVVVGNPARVVDTRTERR